jgi:CHAD domain-containing protein
MALLSAAAKPAAGVGFSALMEDRLRRLIDLVGAVLRGRDPEAIHDMRVASRRLQEALAVGAQAAGETRPPALRILRRLRRTLGDLRDLDVSLELLHELAKELPRAQRASLSGIRRTLSRRRLRALQKMRVRLARLDLPTAIATVEVETERLKAPSARSLQRALQGLIRARRGELSRSSVKARSTWEPADLHGTRIAAKRLRYTLELAAELKPGSEDRGIKALKLLQAQLGRWHDFEVLEDVLIDAIGGRKSIQRNLELAQTALDLVGRVRERQRREVEAFGGGATAGPRCADGAAPPVPPRS